MSEAKLSRPTSPPASAEPDRRRPSPAASRQRKDRTEAVTVDDALIEEIIDRHREALERLAKR
jgi:hypothetical protein